MNPSRYLHWQNQLKSSRLFRRFWAFWGIYSVLVMFATGFYLLFFAQFRAALLALVALVLARAIISPLIYLFYKKQRPYQALKFEAIPSIFFSMPVARQNGFPSDHAASFAAISLVIFWFFPSWGVLLLILTFLNGAGRIVLGYHYINQILAGWVVGIASALIVIHLLSPALLK